MLCPRTAMLFLPSQPPVKLAEKGCTVLGRSRTCDLPLASTDASRRHAEILATGKKFVLRDLGSTNGTFVNGERIDRHDLSPGDRIQIGGELITFCQVEADVEIGEDVDEMAMTIIQEQPTRTEAKAFHGSLTEIPPYALLQILELGQKTGVLELDGEDGIGHLWLQNGSPIHAETKEQVGFDAALTLVRASAGRFGFTPQSESPERTIDASITQLLLEASRLIDEGL